MNDSQKTLARRCLEAAEANTMAFPEIVKALMEAGFESYAVEFRRNVATYFLPSGESVEVAVHADEVGVAREFDATRLQAAIRQAQTQAPGYTYKGFCQLAREAGCAGYVVSFPGRRVVYFGRTAETHVELFPQ